MDCVWTAFPVLEAIPSDGNCFARCSDDVVDVEDWNVYKLTFNYGICTDVHVVHRGVYADISNSFIGMSRFGLQCWCESSETSHQTTPPTYYTEIATGPIGGPSPPRAPGDDIPF